MSDLIHLVCPSCAATNRLPLARLGEYPNCGKCHEPLFNGRPMHLSGATLAKHLQKDGLPLLVDFWAPWCGPCKQMAPAFDQAAGQLSPRVRLAKVNTEAEPAAGQQFAIQSIPTMVLFVGGREKARISGAMNAMQINQWVQQNL